MSKLLLLLLASLAVAAPVGSKGSCTAVTPAKCGTDWSDNCLQCDPTQDYNCLKCCAGCSLVQKGKIGYCECGKGPTPAPGPSPDDMSSYKVGDMNVQAITGGHNQPYSKVVVMLHGGGGSGADWLTQYHQGWFGNLAGFKYVFPTTTLPGGVWYTSTKQPGCGFCDDCAYGSGSIADSASHIAAVIEHERAGVGGDASKVFLGGRSQSAQITAFMQFAKLDYALGGAIVLDGFPLPPVCSWANESPAAAKANAMYHGADMRWMLYHGEADQVFPVGATEAAYAGAFAALGVTATLKVNHTEPGMYHTLVKDEFDRMLTFIGPAHE